MDKFKRVDTPVAQGMLSFVLNAGFATAFFVYGVKDLATNGSCYVAYPLTTPVDIANFDPLNYQDQITAG